MTYPPLMIIGAFRYALGRMSYVVGDTVDWLIENWGDVPDQAKRVIRNELQSEIQRDNENRADGAKFFALGMDCDRAEWVKLYEFIGGKK